MSNVPKEMKKVTDFVWELPTSFKKGMNVPARIYASKKLLDAMDRGVFDQVSNVACLPGIQNYAFCMPDGHWGYGFPIGGVAAFDVEEGVISPGGIGFDINCLHPETKILDEFGRWHSIKDLEYALPQERFSFMDLTTKQKKKTNALFFLKKKADTRVLKITTECGEEIIATDDHPLYTGKEMIKTGELKEGDSVITHPFVGVHYKKPSHKLILDEKDIINIIGKRERTLNTLKKNGLLPLYEDSGKLPILAKLIGYLTGDGWLGKYYNKKRKQDVWSARVIGKREDLEEIQDDVKILGYDLHYMSTKYYESAIKQTDGKQRAIKGTSTQFYINSQSLVVLLHALGVPEGNKSRTPIKVPQWIKDGPQWVKRLYLAGLFGAELNKPCQRKDEGKNFTEPSFSQNKIAALEHENKRFLLDICSLLKEFGVHVNNIYKQAGIRNAYGEETSKLAMRISSNANNLIRLWGTIGYEYCMQRKRESMLAVAYLKRKRLYLEQVMEFLKEATKITEMGYSRREAAIFAVDEGFSGSMVSARLLRKNQGELRVPHRYPAFREFCVAHQVEESEFVRDTIVSIEEVAYDGDVYDFMMNDKDHNFVANSIVSHNCGMRLITTNLTFKDVQPRLRELVDTFFKTVPAGVGCKGFVKASQQQFEDVMRDGVKWCVDNGYGWEEDITKCEGRGKIEGADPSKISDKARQRGINQLGTLGSGNHYLEIQVAHKNNIYDLDTAKKFGITEDGQIVVMLHCGSRGFGHQIATEYLRIFDQAMRKYNIHIPDRELACAPFSSQEGQEYYHAMACAANMAFANRQVILHRIREGFSKVFKKKPEELGLNLVYDVAHNIAKVETYKVDGKMKKLVVHRKGSTRAFGPDNPELIPEYQKTGQPVILGGSMETGSSLLVGTKKAEEETFGSTAHGSGRTMSRTQARREVRGDKLLQDMENRGIVVRSVSMSGLAEEAGRAYKDINDVIHTLQGSGISKPVVLLRPLANVKG